VAARSAGDAMGAKQPERTVHNFGDEAEIFYGIEVDRARSNDGILADRCGEDVHRLLLGRVLASNEAARPFSRIGFIAARSDGRSVCDAQIASIARVSGATLATRDTVISKISGSSCKSVVAA